MISKRLRIAVKNSLLRQYRLAQAIGVDHSTLSGWLNGISRVRQGDPRIVQLGALVGVPARACFATRVRPAKLRQEGVTAKNILGKERQLRAAHEQRRN